jgi:hypothetical protein
LPEAGESEKVTLRLVHDAQKEADMTNVAEPAKTETPNEKRTASATKRYERAALKPAPVYPVERTVIRTQRQAAGN